MKASLHNVAGDTYLELAGVTVGISFNDDGYLFVNVDTTAADEPTGREWPDIYLMLNDAVLHAPRPDDSDVTYETPVRVTLCGVVGDDEGPCHLPRGHGGSHSDGDARW